MKAKTLPKCPRCGATLRSEFFTTMCRNTEACKRRIAKRLEYLRGELRAERISYGDLHELQCLADYIAPGDVELLEAAGVPEYPPEKPLDTLQLSV